MSATAVRSEYAALLSSTLPAVIRSEAENERYIALLEELDGKGGKMTAAANLFGKGDDLRPGPAKERNRSGAAGCHVLRLTTGRWNEVEVSAR